MHTIIILGNCDSVDLLAVSVLAIVFSMRAAAPCRLRYLLDFIGVCTKELILRPSQTNNKLTATWVQHVALFYSFMHRQHSHERNLLLELLLALHLPTEGVHASRS